MPKLMYKNVLYCGNGSSNSGSNPNLIINGDFRVNQRGQSTYSSGGWSSKNTYTVDRWCLHGNPNSTVVVNEDKTLTLNPNSIGEYYFNQYLEEALPLSDYTLTVKVLSLNGNADCHINGSGEPLEVGINTYTLNGSVNNVGVLVYGNSSITIEYIKLEQGSVATPFIPRTYAEELALCEYYFTKGEKEIPILASKTTDQYTSLFSFDEMRVVPTVKNIIAKYFNTSGVYVEASYAYLTPYRKTGFVDITASDMNSRCNGIVVTYELDAEIY